MVSDTIENLGGSKCAVLGKSWAASPAVRRVMQGNKSRDTKPEIAVRSAVHALGMRYRVSTRPLAGLRRTADLVFRSARVAVFVDGCFWHGCPAHHSPPKTSWLLVNQDPGQQESRQGHDRTTSDGRLDCAEILVTRRAYERGRADCRCCRNEQQRGETRC
jgi:DNA mismatch endonuclease Vsr